ncbi:hypothetical protein cypCar_00037077 [Cyprinus carpio]|nr:hypothetical protein cypCar_00037077 [Cyprinus carpio]
MPKSLFKISRFPTLSGVSQSGSVADGPLGSILTVGNLKRVKLNSTGQTGEWKISIDSTSSYSLKVTGRNATLFVSVTGGDSVTVTDVLLVEASGSNVVNGTIKALGATDFLVNIDRIPEWPFVVQLKGLLNDSTTRSLPSRFQRQSPTQQQGSRFTITAQPNSTIEPGTPFVLNFTLLTNATGGSYTIRARTDRSFSVSFPSSLNAGTEGSAQGTITLTAPSNTESGTDVTLTIEAEDPESSDSNYVALRFTVMTKVTDFSSPVCQVVSIKADCPVECSRASWELSTNLTDGNDGLAWSGRRSVQFNVTGITRESPLIVPIAVSHAHSWAMSVHSQAGLWRTLSCSRAPPSPSMGSAGRDRHHRLDGGHRNGILALLVMLFQVVRNPAIAENFTFVLDPSLSNVTEYVTGDSPVFTLYSPTGVSQSGSVADGPLGSILTVGKLKRVKLNSTGQTGEWKSSINSTSSYTLRVIANKTLICKAMLRGALAHLLGWLEVTLFQVVRNPAIAGNFTFVLDPSLSNVTVYVTGDSPVFTLYSPTGESQSGSVADGPLGSILTVGNLKRVKLNSHNQTGECKISTSFYSLKVTGICRKMFCFDFYSHSNWVELGSTAPFSTLIKPDLPLNNIADHGFLHKRAAEMAINATMEVLQDIRLATGNQAFLRLMGLSQTSVLAFVIDTTGSMSDDIEEAKRVSFSIIDSRRGTSEEPSEYILVPFNDPDFGPLTRTEDADLFKRSINSLSASGGGDLPEMCLSGLLLALAGAPQSSDIFVFTDAAAKDLELKSTVQVTFLLTSPFSFRRRRDVSQSQGFTSRSIPLSDIQLYRDLAHVSGGQAIEVTKATLSLATAVITDASTSALVTLFQVVRNPGIAENFTFVLDPSLSNVTVYVTGDSPVFTLYSPTGESQSGSVADGPLGSILTVGNLKRVKLNSTSQTGELKISINSTSSYSLKITGMGFLICRYMFCFVLFVIH